MKKHFYPLTKEQQIHPLMNVKGCLWGLPLLTLMSEPRFLQQIIVLKLSNFLLTGKCLHVLAAHTYSLESKID